MTNRYNLTKEVQEMYTPIIKEFIQQVEEHPNEHLTIDLSDTKLNPSTLIELLETFGYENTNQEDNGWQFDFWITMEKENSVPLSVEGTGITFELRLTTKS